MTAAEPEQIDWQFAAGGGEQQPRVSAAVTAGDSSCGARVSDAETSGPVQHQPGAAVTSHTTLQSSDISESGRVSCHHLNLNLLYKSFTFLKIYLRPLCLMMMTTLCE